MYPIVYISKTAYQKSITEAKRFFHLGIQKEKKPYETAMYPIAYLALRHEIHKSPLEPVELEEIERIVVVDEAIPSNHFRVCTPAHVHFEHEDKKFMVDSFNEEIEHIIENYPLLDVFCKQHTHPWLGGGFLSKKDEEKILEMPDFYTSKGLNTMISIVMSRGRKRWNFHCFGLEKNFKNKRLKYFFIPDEHAFVQEAKAQPYYKTEAGMEWLRNNECLLAENGFKPVKNFLARGWVGYVVKLKSRKIVICIPPFFPSQDVRVLEILDIAKNRFSLLLPSVLTTKESSGHLLEIARHFEEDGGQDEPEKTIL